jgi:uncharacterized delta-60 repeat protein
MIRLMKTYSSARTPGSPKVKKVPLLLFAITVLLAGGAAAGRGQCALDGFDPNANSVIFAVALQPDGKVLIGGQFTTLSPNGGATVASHFIARLNPDGTLDTGFNPNPNFYVRAIALQADGKIVIGGDFSTLSPNGGTAVTRNSIARLNPDGTLDTGFNPDANASVVMLVVQADGKILAGGSFNTFFPNNGAAVTRNRIARLNSDGTIDAVFNPNASSQVLSIAVQTDGKILAGGGFTTIGGQTRNHIARLDATTGAADSFDPNANSEVISIVVQADGKILAGGSFNSSISTPTIGGQTRNRIARLDAVTGLADSFDPNANNTVNAIAVQADGKILAGGFFAVANSIGGKTRYCMARLDATNGLADSFDPYVGGGISVNTIVVQADAKILIGGPFATLSPNGGVTVTRNCIARLEGTPLNIQRGANTNIVLSWATNFTGFTLEVSTNLNTNVWSVVSPAPVVSGMFNVVTNAVSGPPRFYRLRQ